MQVDFPSEIDDINDTDFDILRCLHRNGSLWKMEVTRKINSRRNNSTLLDLKNSITKQAVAKRVERLHELDYIENSIISVDRNGNAQFILGYSTTTKGDKMLLKATRLVLREALSEMITENRNPEEIRFLDHYLSVYSKLSDASTNSIQDFVAAELQQE